MAVDTKWLKAGQDEEDIDLRRAKLGTSFDGGGYDPVRARADHAEANRLSDLYGGWVGITHTLHWTGAIVHKRYYVQRGFGARDGRWTEDITEQVLAEGLGTPE